MVVLLYILMGFCLPAKAELIDGRVLDAETGTPIPGVVIRSGTSTSTTDSAGAFQVNIADGDTVHLSRIGYENLVLAPPHTAPLLLTMRPLNIPLDTIDVVDRLPEADRIAREPTFTTVVERAAFENQVTTLPEILDRSAGIQVRSLGGIGTFSTISVRGSSSEQIEVYLDDIPLNAAVGGGVNLENLPLANIGRIEISRGSGQAGNGLGGTVRIRTRDQADRIEGRMSWGSFDTRNATLFASHRRNRIQTLAVVDYTSSDNDFAFLDDNGTEYNLDDDAVTARQNNEVRIAGLLGKAALDLDDHRVLSVSQTLHGKRQGIPGISNNQSTEAGLSSFRATTQATFEDRAFWTGTTRQTLYFSHLAESFVDTLGEIGVGRQDNLDRTRSYGHRSNTRLLVGRHLLTVKTDLRRETFDPTAHIQLITPLFAARRWTSQVGAALDLGFARDRLTLTGSADVRHQRNRFVGQNPIASSPQAPAQTSRRNLWGWHTGFRVALTGALSLKGNAASSERAPSLFELFGDRGSVVGNTSLASEQGKTFDLGMRLDTERAWAETVIYEQRYEDLIQFGQTSQSVSRPDNVGEARVRGLEFSGWAAPNPTLSVAANYTRQHTQNRSPALHLTGNALPGRPRHKAGVRTDVRVGRLKASYDYAFEGGNFLDQANRRKLDARHIHTVTFRVRVWKSSILGLDARNLTDARVNDVWGYPLPGRSLGISLQNTW